MIRVSSVRVLTGGSASGMGRLIGMKSLIAGRSMLEGVKASLLISLFKPVCVANALLKFIEETQNILLKSAIVNLLPFLHSPLPDSLLVLLLRKGGKVCTVVDYSTGRISTITRIQTKLANARSTYGYKNI